MADNFDSNVAKRKPNVARRSRPVHPWDVPRGDLDEQPAGDARSAPSDADVDGASSNAIEPEPPEIPDGGNGSGAIISNTVPEKAREPVQPAESASDADTVADALPESDSSDDLTGASLPVESTPVIDATAPEPEPPAAPDAKPPKRPAPRRKPANRTTAHAESVPNQPTTRANDLSDAINIHSNFCKLDNDVSDHLLCKLTPSAQSVYVRLYRQSFGWNRNWAAESLPKLTKACNMSLQTVRKAIKELEGIGCIRKEFSDYHKATVYRIYLPSEIGMTNIRRGKNQEAVLRGQVSDTPFPADQTVPAPGRAMQSGDSDSIAQGALKNFEGYGTLSGGQDSVIQSIYFAGTSIYALLESGGALPKNISTYMTDIHLASAVDTIDEFYDSIGFSIVSRSLYHKSVLDYFELLKSGFSHDDIRYAVRWTFKNSRSRPESFSLIKHTMHLAMQDFIAELKEVSREKDLAAEKEETLKRTMEWKNTRSGDSVTTADMKRWLAVVDVLRDELNEQSFAAFIEPLKLTAVEEGGVTLSAPPDSVSWVADHYRDRIASVYRETHDIEVAVTVK